MEITEVRIKLMDDQGERLKAFCSITFDDSFVVRDLKIIDGANGAFVAMPSRKLTSHCPKCGCKNHLRANFCNQCGTRLQEIEAGRDDDGRAKLYADIAHPINSECREMIQDHVITAFEDELQRSKMPGYVPSYEDYDLGDDADESPRRLPPDSRPHVSFSDKERGSVRPHDADDSESTTPQTASETDDAEQESTEGIKSEAARAEETASEPTGPEQKRRESSHAEHAHGPHRGRSGKPSAHRPGPKGGGFGAGVFD